MIQDNFFEDYSQPQETPDTQNQQQRVQDNNEGQSNRIGGYQEQKNQQDQQYQQFEEPTNTQSYTKPQEPSLDYYPEEVTPEMIEMKRKDEEIQAKLQKKASQQRRLKEERKQKGKQDLQKLRSQRIKQVQKNKTQNRSSESKTRQAYSNQWEKVVDNIAVKTGEYPGKKDVARMRDAIVRKSKDVK